MKTNSKYLLDSSDFVRACRLDDGSPTVLDLTGIPCQYDEVKALFDICSEILSSKTPEQLSQERLEVLRLKYPQIQEFVPKPKQIAPAQKPSNCGTPGYVYLAEAKGSNRWKIGRSKNVKERGTALKKQSPFPVVIECVIFSGNHETLEVELHSRFAKKKIHGEWFLLDAADVAYIKSMGGAA